MTQVQHSKASPEQPPDFSLVLGGPLFQLFRRARLTDDALTLTKQRTLVIVLLAWVPLLLLSSVDGDALTSAGRLPFLLDFDVHARFLVALPLLVVAELVVHRRMRSIIQVFLERKLVPERGLPRFLAAVASAFRLRNSLVAELVLIAVVYLFGIEIVWRQLMSLKAETWYATLNESGSKLSLAGIWYGYVSMPIFQFLLCRWYFRLFVWARFLWHVSRIELDLMPMHPDRLGGLGFLPNVVTAFTPLAAAHGALLAGVFASRIFYANARLTDFKLEVGALIALMLCFVFGPLLVFSPQLAGARRKALREYGTFAQGYVRAFERKWLRGDVPVDEQLLGTSDVQSLADLGSSFEVITDMRTLPVTKDAAFQLVLVTVLPIVPLVLTMMPLEQLVKALFGLLF